jgi:hypothetical protein
MKNLAVEAIDGITDTNKKMTLQFELESILKQKQKAAIAMENPGYMRTYKGKI